MFPDSKTELPLPVDGDGGELTEVVVDEVSSEGRLLVLPSAIHAGVGVGRVHWENVSADAHKFCLPHQLPDG